MDDKKSKIRYEKKSDKLYEKADKHKKIAEKSHSKIKNKKVVRKYTLQDGMLKVEKTEEKLKMGERTKGQKLSYQAAHQGKKLIVDEFDKAKQGDGNEGIDIVEKSASKLKEQVVKPFVRKHTPIGFDRHQFKEQKHALKEKKALAKAGYNEKLNKTELSKNRVKSMYQKSRIKKEMYAQHGLRTSLVSRIKQGVTGTVGFIDPFRKAREIYLAISSAISGLGLMLKISMMGAVIFVLVVIPVILVINLISIFFNWDNGDYDQVAIAKLNTYWSEKVVDLKLELIEADNTEMYKNLDIDEVRLDHSSISSDTQKDLYNQIELIGMLSSLHQDKLNETIAKATLDKTFESIYVVNSDIVNEPYQSCSTDPATGEESCSMNDYYVLYLSLTQNDIPSYVNEQINFIDDADKKDLAQTMMEQYRALFGLGQFINNPFGEKDWRISVSSAFGYRLLAGNKDNHTAIDIAMPRGEPILSPGNGTVIEAKGGCPVMGSLDSTCNGGRGNYVVVEMKVGDKLIDVKYLHLEKINVSVGQELEDSIIIGTVGSSGKSTGYHLHLGAEYNGKLLNPLFLVEW